VGDAAGREAFAEKGMRGGLMMRCEWNIDDDMNDLMVKYDIGRHQPAFYQWLQAKEIIRKKYREFCENNQKIVLVSENLYDIRFCMDALQEEPTSLILKLSEDAEIIREKTDSDTTYLVCSFPYQSELTMRLFDAGRKVYNLYDIFESEGLLFEHSYYVVYSGGYYDHSEKRPSSDYERLDLNAAFFWHRRRYEISSGKIRRRYLEKAIFDCAFARDFVTLKEYIGLYEKEYAEFSKPYTDFLEEVSYLLDRIKKELHLRQPEHCLMIWLDQVPYAKEQDMPFLKSLDEKSLCFENMYTMTPYTNPTIRLLFSKKRPIEEKSYKQKNFDEKDSVFLRNLQSQGYQFRYYGTFRYYFGSKYADLKDQMEEVSPFSYVFWLLLRDMILCQPTEKFFYVIHELMQTHSPSYSFGLRGDNYVCEERKGEQEQMQNQRMESWRYVDRLLEFYFELLPDSLYQIYMSDHGYGLIERFHVVFKVLQKRIRVRKVREVISYYDFDRIVDSVLRKNGEGIEEISNGYALLEDVDVYNKNLILKKAKEGRISYTMTSYKGIATEQEIFLSYRNGKEQYFALNSGTPEEIEDRKNALRDKMDLCWINVAEEEHFKYSRVVIEALTGEMRKKKSLLIEFLEMVFQKGRVAIRGGGDHTLYLLDALNVKQKEKISFIIDKNKKDVMISGFPVIAPEEFDVKTVDVVLISSWFYRESMKSEMQQMCATSNVEVLDFYDYAAEKGILCTSEFYCSSGSNIDQKVLDEIARLDLEEE